MRMDYLKVAIKHAERFLNLAKALRDSHEKHYIDYIGGTKLSGATKRASMELTRKLADLRAGR